MPFGRFQLLHKLRRRRGAILLLGVCLLAQPMRAQIDWERYEAEAVELLLQYFRIDTSNPPGNEKHAAEFFCGLFAREGIECRIFEFAPGRANAYARLRGNGAKRPIVLLNHTDVVPAVGKDWSVPPFSAEMRDGSIYARGAQDMKAEGMLHAMVLLALKREGVPLERDVIFLAVGDEEFGGQGSGWMLEHQRALLADAEYLINEGGENLIESGRVPFWGVDVAEKAPFWLRLVARGKAGHGSIPDRDSATHRLARALARVTQYETPFKVLPETQRQICDQARVRYPREAQKLCDLKRSLTDRAFRRRVARNTDWNALLRNTISLTVLRAGSEPNIIPAEAEAQLDVRLLPGEDPQEFLEQLRGVVADRQISIEPILTARATSASPVNTELWRVFESVVARHFPGTRVTPHLLTSSTESPLYRQLGIVSYGFCPFVTSEAESETPHGTDERIDVQEYRRGLRVLYDVVKEVSGRR